MSWPNPGSTNYAAETAAVIGNMRAGRFNPLDFGAVGDGVTDDTAAFLAMNAAAATGSGTIYLPPLRFGISDEVEFSYRSVAGSGGLSHQWEGAHAGGTEFVALHADACVRLFSSYSSIGGFGFDGAGIATQGVLIGGTSGGFFHNISSTRCAGDGIILEDTNNAVMTAIATSNNGGHGMVCRGGIGSVQIHQIQANHNRKTNLYITGVGGVGANAQPHVHFIGGVLEWSSEYDNGTATGGSASTLVDSGASWTANDLAGAWVTMDPDGGNQEGRRIVSNTATTITVTPDWTTPPTTEDYLIVFPAVTVCGGDVGFYQAAIVNAPGETPTLDIWRDDNSDQSSVTLMDTAVIGGGASIGVAIEGSNATLTCRDPYFGGHAETIRLIGTSAALFGELPESDLITLQDGANFDLQVSNRNFGMKRWDIMLDAAHSTQWIQVGGESGLRFQQRADGEFSWGNGTDFTDTNLYRGGANLLKTDDGFQCAGTYDLPLRLGDYRLWVNPGDGKLYIKSSAPSSATDGVVVGTQS